MTTAGVWLAILAEVCLLKCRSWRDLFQVDCSYGAQSLDSKVVAMACRSNDGIPKA